jgi:hypothetical protein
MRYKAISSLLGMKFFSLDGKQQNIKQNHIVSFFIEPTEGFEAKGYVVNLGDGEFEFVIEDGGSRFDNGTKGDIFFVNNLSELTYTMSLERLDITYEDEEYSTSDDGSVRYEGSKVKSIRLRDDEDKHLVSKMLNSFIPFPSFSLVGSIEMDKGAVGLMNTSELIILGERISDNYVSTYYTPFSNIPPYVKVINGVPCLATYRIVAKADDEAVVFEVSSDRGSISEGENVELVAPISYSKVEYEGKEYKLRELGNFSDIPIKRDMESAVSPIILHYGMKADNEGVFDSTLSLSLIEEFVPLANDYSSVSTQEEYKNLVSVYPFCTITITSEVEGLDDRLRTFFTNFGVPDPKDYQEVFKDAPSTTLDARFINDKSKELYLIHQEIFPYAGTYKGLLNAVNYLGYDDIFFREWYTRVDNPEEKSPEVGFISMDVKKGMTLSSKLKATNITYGEYLDLKKLRKLSLVYNLNKVVGEDKHSVPVTEKVYDYTQDVLLLKLYALRSWLSEHIIGLQSEITDIVGEASFFHGHPVRHYATGGSLLEVEKLMKMRPMWESDMSIIENDSYGTSTHVKMESNGNNIKISDIGDKTFRDFVDYAINASPHSENGFDVSKRMYESAPAPSTCIVRAEKWNPNNSLEIPFGATFNFPAQYENLTYVLELDETDTFALFEATEDYSGSNKSSHILVHDNAMYLPDKSKKAEFSRLPSFFVSEGRIYNYDHKYGFLEIAYEITSRDGKYVLIKDGEVVHSSEEPIVITPSNKGGEKCTFEYDEADSTHALCFRYDMLGDNLHAIVIDNGYLIATSISPLNSEMEDDEIIYFSSVTDKNKGIKTLSITAKQKTRIASVSRRNSAIVMLDRVCNQLYARPNVNINQVYNEKVAVSEGYGAMYVTLLRAGNYTLKAVVTDEYNNVHIAEAKKKHIVTRNDITAVEEKYYTRIVAITEDMPKTDVTTDIIIQASEYPILPMVDKVQARGSMEVSINGVDYDAVSFEDKTISSNISKGDFVYMDNLTIRAISGVTFTDDKYIYLKVKRNPMVSYQGLNRSGAEMAMTIFDTEQNTEYATYNVVVERAYSSLKSVPDDEKLSNSSVFDSNEVIYLKCRVANDKYHEFKDTYESIRKKRNNKITLGLNSSMRRNVIADDPFCRNWIIDGVKFASLPVSSFSGISFERDAIVKLSYLRDIGVSGGTCISECAYKVIDIKHEMAKAKEYSVFWKFKKLVDEDEELKRTIYNSRIKELVFINGWFDTEVAHPNGNHRISTLSGKNVTTLQLSNAHNTYVQYIGKAETSQSTLNGRPFVILDEETSIYAPYMDSTFELYGRRFDENRFRSLWASSSAFGSERVRNILEGNEGTMENVYEASVLLDKATIKPNTNIIITAEIPSSHTASPCVLFWRIYNNIDNTLIGECHNASLQLNLPLEKGKKETTYRVECEFIDSRGNKKDTIKPFFVKVRK